MREIFDAARDIAAGERASFLDKACAGDPGLREAVESLLASEHQRDTLVLEGGRVNAETVAMGSETTQHSIGPYRLQQKIGEGGLGEVWLAEQKQPVRRRVALKLIKAGMDTREVVARFESERQALALMDHPAIAKVLDAGSTPEGRPYFVMEYVPGIPITDYCDQHKLEIEDRLELFMHACEGVQHAHQKAIIHRDLKPSNILVTEVDGKPAPKIIDFGVAKATSQRLTAETLLTRVGTVIGTPEYMSPEQANSAGEDIDTRTDVYSLGVVLYELLVGVLPLEFAKLSFAELLHKLRDEDAPRPSTKVSTQGGEVSATAARNRRVDSPTLIRRLRGDLDAITLKALEKERSRRYATPTELAADIGRYLRNEPVVARPASAAYRARKYVRRHRIGVAVAAGGFLVLASFAVLEAVQLRRITRESEQRARITEFMTNMFKVSNPSEARGNSVTAREILDKASKQVDTGLAKDPEVQAQMMHVMGNVYESLGLYTKAEELLKKAVELRRRVLGPANAATLTSMASLAVVLDQESRYPESEKLSRETLDARRSTLGPEHRDTLASINQLALVLNNEGRFPEAEKLHREVVDIATRVLGPQDTTVLRRAKHDLAIDLAYEGKFTEAENIFREILENDRRAFGPDHPDVLGDMNNLGATLQHEEKWADAEKLYLEALPKERRVDGAEHPYTLMTMGNLALVYVNERRYADAEKLFRETLDIKRRVLGPEHRSTLVTMGNLADTLREEGKFPEAESLFRANLEVMRRTLGESHSDYLSNLYGLGQLLQAEGHYAEAERVMRSDLEGRRRALGESHPDTGSSYYALAEILAQEGKREEALRTLQNTLHRELLPDTESDMEKDEAFKSLRGDPRFAALVAQAKQQAAARQKAH